MNARRIVFILLWMLAAVPILGHAQTPGSPVGLTYKVGMTQRVFTPSEPYNWRGAKTHALVTTIWYPAEAGAVEQPQWIGSPESPFACAEKAAPDAKLVASPGRFPLIALSHGTGSSAAMMAWLGTALAARGYIAAAVNQPGNNGVDGYTLEGFLLWWERARDLSRVDDGLLADKVFGARVDANRIGAAGFSLGGFTMMEIAGGRANPALYQEFCKSPRADGMCVDPFEFPGLRSRMDEVGKSDAAAAESLRRASESYRDPRVRAVFAIAPALGPAFLLKSLGKISIRVGIVAGEADSVVPVGSSARFFAEHIPHAKLTLLPGVGHYTFLATCADLGHRVRPDVCTDAEGVDRDAVHAQTARMALDFFAANLR